MSLLDDVSIVVTPNGYKAGELHAVKPTFALRSELVTNGDLSNETVGFTSFNSTIANTSNTLEITNTASYGSAGADVLTTIIGKRYKFTADIKGGTSSTALMRAGKNPNGIDLLNVTAFPITSTFVKHTFYFVATTTTSYVSLWSGSPTIGDTVFFDNISVKEITGADMDVTRETAATRVDENGLVNYAEVVTGSDIVTDGDFTDGSTAWALNGWTISDNAANGNGLTANLIQSISGSANKNFSLTFTISNYISGNVIPAFVGNSLDSLVYSSNGTFTEVISSGSDIRFVFYGASFSGSISNVSLKEVTRDNVPRIDYTGGGCPHILAEPMRTNLITYSEDLTDSSWIKLRNGTGLDPVITSNYTTSPDGTNNASRVVFDAGTVSATNFSMLRTNATGLTNPHDSSISIYLKSNTASSYTLIWYNESLGSEEIIVTPTWARYTLSTTSIASTSDRLHFGLWDFNGAVSSNNADVSVWGAQLEVGSYATSYIPNFGTALGVTRNQDLFTRDGIGSLINDSEGILFAEWKPKISSDYSFFSINNGTSSETVTIGKNNNTTSMVVGARHLGAYKILYVSSSHDLTIFNKVAVKWKAGDYAIWVNGVEVLTSTSATIPTAMNKLSFDFGDGGFDFYGEIKQLQVYNTALTDEQLLQLTGTSGTDFYESYAEMASALTYTIQ